MKKRIKYSKVPRLANGGLASPQPVNGKYANLLKGLPPVGGTVEGEVSNAVPQQPITMEKPKADLSSVPTVASEGSAALSGAASGASMGSMAGPIGTAVGAAAGMVMGVIGNQKKQKEAQEAENAILNQRFQEQKMQDALALENYNTKGNLIQYYAKGGKLAKANSSSLTTGKYRTIGGNLKPISDNAEEAVGNEHGERTIDNSDGITLVNKSTNRPEANIEDGEVVINDSLVYSDRLKFDKKNTYADVAKNLAKKREKLTTYGDKHKDSKTQNGIERQLAGLDIAENDLFNSQELHKMMTNNNRVPMMKKGGDLVQYADGGKIDPPKKEKLATRQDSVSVANSSKRTAAYYRKLGYKEVVERDPAKIENSLKFLDEQAARFKKENRPNTIIEGDTRDRRVIAPELYRQDVSPNIFNQRETANAILNVDAPMTRYDRRIKPTSISKFTAPDGLYKDDLVSVPSYADLFEHEKKKKVVPTVKPKVVAEVPKPTVVVDRPYVEGRNKVYDTDFVQPSRNLVSDLTRKEVSKADIKADILKKKAMLASDKKVAIPRLADGGNISGNKFGQFMGDIAPNLIDNLGNLILTKNTPKLAKPLLNRPEQLKTTINVNPQLAEVQDTTTAMTDNILANTSNSNVARANLAATNLAGLKQRNAIYATKENTETELENQNKMNIQGTRFANTAILTEHQAAVRARANDIQGKYSANLANFSKDIGDAQEKAKMRDYYDQVLALDVMDDKTGEKGRTYSRIPSLQRNRLLQETLKAETLRKKGKTKTYNFDPSNLRYS